MGYVDSLTQTTVLNQLQDSPEHQNDANISKIWGTITKEFFEGWPIDPTEEESKLIEYFIERPKFKDILLEFIKESLVEVVEVSYSNYTKVKLTKA